MADTIPSAFIDRKAELEQRYIRLLEARIADLEALAKINAKPNSSEAGSTSKDTNGKKDGVDALEAGKQSAADSQAEDRKKRIRSVVSKWNPQTGVRTDVPVNDTSLVEKDKGNVAFTFRRVLPLGSGQNPNDGFSEVDIESRELRDLLGEVIGEYTGQSWEGTIVNIRSPFAPLVHFWDSLQTASKPNSTDNEPKKQARLDLELLLEQVIKDSELDAYFKTRESNLAANLTTYETMWTLFIPGQRVYAKPFLGLPQMFVVQSPPMFWERERTLPATVEMDCWCYDWNGKDVVKVWYYIKFDRFRGTKPINELVAYPTKYYKEENPKAEFKNEEELIKHLIERGFTFDETVRGRKGASQQHEYDGEALADRRNVIKSNRDEEDEAGHNNNNDPGRPRVNEDKKIRPVKVKGKYIVDHEAFLTYGSGNHTLAELEPNDVQDVEVGLVDERTPATEAGRKYLGLLPPRYLGYATGDKFWGQFSVKATAKVTDERKTMFKEQLKLKEEYKEMIQALVSSHESKNSKKATRPQVKDVVEDKGKGLVILLHGPPGVGKTLTAETIAEASGKPLFVVSVAEIGLNASKAEKNLEQMFALAGSWEAVLLVDEADVFLESRTRDGDANRNALVSVLLRVLEYYQGIMILTTNRITSLDVAVQSRIHLAIRYEDLSGDQKKDIFEMFLNQLNKQEPESIDDRKSIDEWVGEYGIAAKLNGRQIRNVISSALALARSKPEVVRNGGDDRLTVKHIKRVVRITHEFQEQLEAVTTASRMLNEVKGK